MWALIGQYWNEFNCLDLDGLSVIRLELVPFVLTSSSPMFDFGCRCRCACLSTDTCPFTPPTCLSGKPSHASGYPVADLAAPPSGLESVVRLWSPRGEEEEVIGDDEAADSDPDSRSLEDIAQSNQGSMDSGETLSRATLASLQQWCYG